MSATTTEMARPTTHAPVQLSYYKIRAAQVSWTHITLHHKGLSVLNDFRFVDELNAVLAPKADFICKLLLQLDNLRLETRILRVLAVKRDLRGVT